MHWFRSQRRLVSWLALSLVLKLVLTGLHVPIAVAAPIELGAGDQSAPSVTSSIIKVVICTPSGLRTVALDADGTPVDDGSGVPEAAPECGLCSVLQIGLSGSLATGVSLHVPHATTISPVADFAAVTPRVPARSRGHDPPIL